MWRILIIANCEVREYTQFVNVKNINNLYMWRILTICICEEYNNCKCEEY
jgi:hypothetical protein